MEDKYYIKLSMPIREGDGKNRFFETENGFNYFGSTFLLQYRQTSKNYHEVKIVYKGMEPKIYKYRNTKDAIIENVIPFVKKYD